MLGLYSSDEIRNFLFFDIETVYGTDDYQALSPIMHKHWERRVNTRGLAKFVEGEDPDAPDYENVFKNQSAIHPEFGRVVCVSFGYLSGAAEETQFKLKSLYGKDEKQLLIETREVLNKHIVIIPQPQKRPKALCGHNIKGFDVPFLAKRYLVHGLELPIAFRTRNKKPWELNHFEDTMEAWKFTDFRGTAPLELLTELFGIPSPKDALAGEHVSAAFWERDGLKDIAHYCEQDVLATARLMQRWCGEEMVPDANVEFSVPAQSAEAAD